MRQKAKPSFKLRSKFGQRIRELRKEARLSQEDLSFRANIHRTYIGSVERGEQNISLDNISKLAKSLKISLSDLFQKI